MRVCLCVRAFVCMCVMVFTACQPMWVVLYRKQLRGKNNQIIKRL